MTAKPRGLLGMLLALVDAGRWLAPPSRRREWRRQWRADIWHQWDWMATHDAGLAGRASLARRTAGAFRHAFWLRLHVRRVEMITQDLRYGWRQMVRRPGTTAVAVLTLGIGIGANVMMYSWLDGRLRRLVPGVADAGRIVALNGASRTRKDLSTSYPDFVDLRQRRPATIEDLVVFEMLPMNMRVGRDDPQRVFGEIVSGNYFEMLGVKPAQGRGFRTEETTVPNTHAVAIVSYNFWQRRFAGDPSMVGREIVLNGQPFTVIGIAPQGFHGTQPYLNLDLWVPLMMQQALMAGGDRLTVRGHHWLQSMVRLRPGVSVARAQADLDVVAHDIAKAYPKDSNDGVILYELWRAPSMGGIAVTAVMGVQLGVSAVVLLIACANVASLLLASAATRQRETAVRLTLGASRTRLVQQLLTESTLLAAAGGAAGLLFAYWTRDLARWFIPPAPLPIEINPALDVNAFVFAAAVTVATALVFGLVPALHGSSTSVMTALKEAGAATTAAPHRARLRRALVVAQVALSLLLLVSAGLFLRTLANAQSVDPGFSTRSGLLAAIDLQPAGYDDAHGMAFEERLLERAREIRGVEAATLIQRMPLGFSGSADTGISVDGYTPAPNEEVNAYYTRIGSDYFRTLGIGIVEGRALTERDRVGAPDVVVINETMARRYFAGRPAVGGHIRMGRRTIEVVGIVRDGKYQNISEAPRTFMYLPIQQWYRPDFVLVLKTAGDPAAVVGGLHATMQSLDPNVPLFDVRTIAEHLQISVFLQRMIASLLSAFGVLALLLATVGLYGVVAAIVTQRTVEIGMRMALGARGRDIITLILRQSFGMIGVGLAIGLATAFGVTRVFRSLLVGVSATDGAIFAATTALLALVALAATFLPARRAAAVDPLTALRCE